MNKKILIAAAWPYANGSLHLGHVAGLLPADILARFWRLKGASVLYVSGSDCHGTPISVEAEKQGLAPLEVANKYHQEFVDTLLSGLNFSYDNYTNTLTDTHRDLVQEMFLDLHGKGLIYPKTEDLPHCDSCNRFLPDRYVEGICPHCQFNSARGDQCDNCGKMLDAKDLLSPRCKLCGTEPQWRPSEHFYLKLSAFSDQLTKWLESRQGWRGNALNFSRNLISSGLPDRAITRDLDWGIEVPLPGYETKRIYVWFEAVCGYLSASKEWAQKQGKPEAWLDFWRSDDVFHYYVHGKDNIPFHSIILPAILMGAGGYHLPDMIVSSEYLTLEYKQFSKSRHWAVWLPDFLANFSADSLRYYLVIAGPETADADFSWSEFASKHNNELISTFGNFVNRVFSLCAKHFPAGLKAPENLDSDGARMLKKAEDTFSLVAMAIEKANLREGLRSIFALVDEANAYVNRTSPWKSVKEDPAKAELDLAILLQIISALTILIAPYLPSSADSLAKTLGLEIKEWRYPEPQALKIGEFSPLFTKLSEEDIEREVAKLGKE